MTRCLPFLVLVAGATSYLSGSVPSVARSLNSLPLRFEENLGLVAGKDVRYVARGDGYLLKLSATGAAIDWKGARVDTEFAGGRASAVVASDRLSSSGNYFIGKPAEWHTDVPGYGAVRYQKLYPGIDLLFHGEQGKLEYDFVIRPHADPSKIRLELTGQTGLRVDSDGELVISTASGELRWKAPVVYQTIAGRRQPVDGRFVISMNRSVSFALGEYDANRELVIDPTLAYSTYLGGKNNEIARGIGLDAAGNVYIGGKTTSTDLPTKSAVQANFGGTTANYFAGDAFVAKFSPTGALLYLTYLGGSGDEGATALAVDAAGNAYITGATTSADFPTRSPFQTHFGGMGGSGYARFGDAFVAKLSPSGNQLLYSTFLGGSQDDIGLAIAIDSAGNAYVGGATQSGNFPTSTGAYQTTYKGGGGEPVRNDGRIYFDAGDGFVTKLSPSGQLVFSTYIGGSLDDLIGAIAVDASNNVYVGGYTLSFNFPTTPGAYQLKNGGTEAQNFFFNYGDGFVSKLNATGSTLIYSTYFGGLGDEAINGLAVDGAGNAFVTGFSSSTNLKTTPGAFQTGYAGYLLLPFLIEQLYGDAFVGKLNPTGSAFVYLTLLGGNNNDSGSAIAIDSSGNAYVTGFTDSLTFPRTQDALQPRLAGDGNGDVSGDYILYGDVFLSVVNPAGTKLVYSTYFGGTMDEGGAGIALDGKGNVYLTGGTVSTNFPATANAVQSVYGGGPASISFPRGDAFYAVFSGFAANGPVLNAITNSASGALPPVSPGMVFTGYGLGMGPGTLAGAQLDSSGHLASKVADAQMLFDEEPAPIVYALDTQFAGIVPYSVAGKSSVQVVSVYQGQRSAPLTVTIGAAAPGLYSTNLSGHGPAVAFNQDGKKNTADNPAAKGSVIVLFGTGEGLVSPTPADGTIAAAPPNWKPEQKITMSVGGQPAKVLYANTPPFEVAGVLQVNAQLSANTPSGAQPIVLTVGTAPSQANLTIFVK